MAHPVDPADDVFHPNGQVRLDLFHEASARVLEQTLCYARRTHWESVRSPHLFMGLLAAPDAGVREWGERLGADLPRLLEQFRELFHQEDGEPNPCLKLHREFLSDNVIRLLREAHQRAAARGRGTVTPMDLLISVFTTPHSVVAECFERVGMTAARLTELAVMAERAGKERI